MRNVVVSSAFRSPCHGHDVEFLRFTEVLRCVRQQVDLQALRERHGELSSVPGARERCSALLAKTTELPELQGMRRI
jgi:hypothetical protein